MPIRKWKLARFNPNMNLLNIEPKHHKASSLSKIILEKL